MIARRASRHLLSQRASALRIKVLSPMMKFASSPANPRMRDRPFHQSGMARRSSRAGGPRRVACRLMNQPQIPRLRLACSNGMVLSRFSTTTVGSICCRSPLRLGGWMLAKRRRPAWVARRRVKVELSKSWRYFSATSISSSSKFRAFPARGWFMSNVALPFSTLTTRTGMGWPVGVRM